MRRVGQKFKLPRGDDEDDVISSSEDERIKLDRRSRRRGDEDYYSAVKPRNEDACSPYALPSPLRERNKIRSEYQTSQKTGGQQSSSGNFSEDEVLVLSRAIIDTAKRLYKRDMLASGDGNISMRLSNGDILITPSGKQKAFLEISEMAICKLDGTNIRGKSSSETPMHLFLYRNFPEAKAVVHAHPPHAVAWTLAHPTDTELPVTTLPELLLALGQCPIVPYQIPGTVEMGTALEPYVATKNRAFLLQFHGALTWGETLQEATGGMERVEHASEMLCIASTMCRQLPTLPSKALGKLEEIRRKLHPRLL